MVISNSKISIKIRNAIEENNPIKKTKHQITDSTRKNPDVRTRDITIDSSTKEKDALNLNEEVIIPKLHLLQCLNTFVIRVASHFKQEMVLYIIKSLRKEKHRIELGK